MQRKLVLYSDQIIPENSQIDQRLLGFVAKGSPRIGYIPSAGDPEGNWYDEKCKYYAKLGVTLHPYFELDLNYDDEQRTSLFECDAIHLSGGNTFYFLHWLRQRSMLGALRDYVAKGGILVGVSAGAILMTPEISSARLCGDQPGSYHSDGSSLGLVDFLFLPHFQPELLNSVRSFQEMAGRILYACPDGSGVVVDGDRIELYGEVLKLGG